MRFGIDIGHNASPDIGATGIRQEDDLTREVGTRVITRLRSLGHTVIDCTPSRASSVTNSLWQRCNTANVNRVDLFVSIHFNKFNGRANGTEIFVASDAGRSRAQPVLNAIVAMGYFNRGLKNGAHLYVLRNTAAPAMLVECCFIDSRADMDRYNSDRMADAIVQGLTGQTAPPAPPDEDSKPVTEILQLQKTLNQLRITDASNRPLTEDGLPGPATEAATRKLQAVLGLATDGIAGERTWRNIRQVLAKPTLYYNHAAGPAVRYLQFRVGADVDGIFGPGTRAEVMRFQSMNRLVVDGIVGPASWRVLIG